MRVLVYPADEYGCGYHRVIWPAQELQRQGHDVRIMWPHDRQLAVHVDDRTGEVLRVETPPADVIVFQRVAHRYVAGAVAALRRRGIAVVIDVDDNLNAIHPKNPAWAGLHPQNEGKTLTSGRRHMQSWEHLMRSCRAATMVTVSTPALIPVYGRQGAVHVLYNRLVDSYFQTSHVDSDVIGWPASYHSHPDDPYVTKDAVAQVVDDGATFRMLGDPTGAGRAFKLSADPKQEAETDIEHWPSAVATLGIGIAPAAPTIFNASKSWLKPLEMSACGVPWVASPIVEYMRLYDMGAGVIASTKDEWYRELTRLRADVEWRTELAETGRAVAKLHQMRDHAWRWWEAWDQAYQLQRGRHAKRAKVMG